MRLNKRSNRPLQLCVLTCTHQSQSRVCKTNERTNLFRVFIKNARFKLHMLEQGAHNDAFLSFLKSQHLANCNTHTYLNFQKKKKQICKLNYANPTPHSTRKLSPFVELSKSKRLSHTHQANGVSRKGQGSREEFSWGEDERSKSDCIAALCTYPFVSRTAHPASIQI